MKLYSSREVCEIVGLSRSRVLMEAKEHAVLVGSGYAWTEEGIKYLQERKGKVGRPVIRNKKAQGKDTVKQR